MFLCNFAICVCFFVKSNKSTNTTKRAGPCKDNVSGQQSNRGEVSLSSNVPFWKHMDFCNYKQPCIATWCYMVMLRAFVRPDEPTRVGHTDAVKWALAYFLRGSAHGSTCSHLFDYGACGVWGHACAMSLWLERMTEAWISWEERGVTFACVIC
jgi:hypothetical protein